MYVEHVANVSELSRSDYFRRIVLNIVNSIFLIFEV